MWRLRSPSEHFRWWGAPDTWRQGHFPSIAAKLAWRGTAAPTVVRGHDDGRHRSPGPDTNGGPRAELRAFATTRITAISRQHAQRGCPSRCPTGPPARWASVPEGAADAGKTGWQREGQRRLQRRPSRYVVLTGSQRCASPSRTISRRSRAPAYGLWSWSNQIDLHQRRRAARDPQRDVSRKGASGRPGEALRTMLSAVVCCRTAAARSARRSRGGGGGGPDRRGARRPPTENRAGAPTIWVCPRAAAGRVVPYAGGELVVADETTADWSPDRRSAAVMAVVTTRGRSPSNVQPPGQRAAVADRSAR